MQVHEQKVQCELEREGRLLEATLHLIEIRYNERITFWNAVGQLTEDEARRLGPIPATNPTVGLRLPDERSGFLEITHFKSMEGYFELAGTGKPNKEG